MNRRRTKELRQTAPEQAPDRKTHRTVPLLGLEGRLVGHGCRCCRLILTPAGHVSAGRRVTDDGLSVAVSKAHMARVKALAKASKRKRRRKS